MKTTTKSQLFINRHSVLAVLFIVIQQGIVASSTFFIARLSSDIANGKDFTWSLILFAASLVIVFIPAGIANVMTTLSKWHALDRYVYGFTNTLFGKATLRSDEKFKKQLSAFLSTESYLVLDEGHKFIFDWISTSLNVVFNIVALGMVLDQRLVVAYSVSAVLVTVFLKFSNSIAYRMSNKLQNSRLKLQHYLSSGWENILVGNKYSHELWQKEYSNSIKTSQANAADSEAWNFIGSSLGMVLAMLPVFTATGFLFFENAGNRTMLAVLVSTLPRQILILQHTHVVVYYATSWSALKAKLDGLLKSLMITGDFKIADRISFDQIRIFRHDDQNTHNPKSVNDVLELLKSNATGRLTIRGSNGSGKSTLLNLIKEQMGETAFLLPAQTSLQFNDTVDIGLSTGQKLAIQLEEISKNVRVSHILLDEWDANLDSIVQNKMNDLIDQISKNAVVLEVRHRD